MARKEKTKVAIKKSNNKNGIGQQIQKQIGISVTVVLSIIATESTLSGFGESAVYKIEPMTHTEIKTTITFTK